MSESSVVVRFQDCAPQPWANGLGTTTELYRDPRDGEFLVRLSVATIDSDAPFSALPGVDRCLLALGPDPLTLVVDGGRQVLQRHEVLAFAGEAVVVADGVRRPGRDLNLMLRRGRAAGSLVVQSVSGRSTIGPADDDGLVIVVGLADAVRADGVAIGELDAVIARDQVDLDGVGDVAVYVASAPSPARASASTTNRAARASP